MNIELLERLPVDEIICDENYRSVAMPCHPFPGDKPNIADEMAEGVELLEAA